MALDLDSGFNALPALVWRAVPDGSIDYFNVYYLEYVGLEPNQADYWDFSAAIHPEDRDTWAATWRSVLASGKPGEGEARLRRSDGAYRWFLLRANPVRDEHGTISKWYGVSTDIDDQKRAEEALRDSEHNFRLTIDTIPALAWTARPDGSAEFVSQHYLDYVGLSAQQAQGWGWSVAVHPDDLSGLAATWQAIMASGQPGEAEARLRRFDGEYRWLLFRTSPLRDAAGNIAKWYGVNTDIDDRKRAETNLSREKHLLEMIASGRPLRDVLGALCEMVEEAGNGCYCDVHPIDWRGPIIEYSVAPSLPSSYTDPMAGASLSGDALPCAIAACQNTQVVAEDMDSDPRWRGTFARGHVLKHGLRSVWSTPIHARDGKVLGTLCLYQRQPARPSPEHQGLISHATHLASIAIERSRTEAALRRSETLLAEGQRLSATGSFSWRVDTDEVAFSEELCRIFEFDPNAMVTLERIRARIHPEDTPLFLAQTARARAGHGHFGYETRLLMPDGRVKYLRTFGHVVHHQDGRQECLAAVQDVTERRLADEELGRARSDLAHVARVMSLGAMTASIAHEVNQPLSGIVTNASTCLRMLASDPPNVEGARETARRTIRDGNRAADVIARLRALFGKKKPAIEPVDLNGAAREVIALVWTDLQRSRVTLHTELADGLPPVGGDRVQLQQVVMNLLRNAADAMIGIDDHPRRLVVRTGVDEGDRVRLSVEDTGIGFAPEATERLFQAFYTTKEDGMGIGLSVCRSIIESHAGRLWAESGNGPGATFSFSIPHYRKGNVPRREADATQSTAAASADSAERL